MVFRYSLNLNKVLDDWKLGNFIAVRMHRYAKRFGEFLK